MHILSERRRIVPAGSRVRLRIVFAVLLLVLAPAHCKLSNEDSPLGINLGYLVDWNPGWAFVDIFRHARPWIPQHTDDWIWDTGEPIAKTPQGWVAELAPAQAAGTLMVREIDDRYPAGEYLCLYDGEGTIEFRFAATVVSTEPGRIVLNVTPENDGIYLKLVATNPQNPVRNIRVIMPGFEDTYRDEPFHPLFVDRLRKFKVIRFANWQGANCFSSSCEFRQWEDRITPDYYTQATDSGVAIEYIVKLVNKLGADPWLSIPHLADDQYVRGLATYVRDHIGSQQTVYVEHSNEVWNSDYPQHQYAKERGLALGLSANPYEASLRYHSQRSVEIFRIFEDVFGGTERIVRVLGAHNSNQWSGITIMDWREAWRESDALAVAAYMSGVDGSEATVDEVLDAVEVDIDVTIAEAEANMANAADRGLALIAYEGGQHLVGGFDERLTALYAAANRHDRMYNLYLALLGRWRTLGGTQFLAFTYIDRYDSYGSWGALERQDQDLSTAPKYRALLDFIEANPSWW